MSASTPTFNAVHDLQFSANDRISAEDAARQKRTACEILLRLERQPGLILADEVGMGKTFVALAVAAAAHFTDRERRPVVVMVPPALSDKWPRDAGVFKDSCLPEPWKSQFRFSSQPITSGIHFLKMFDDEDLTRRNSVVFVTHGALYRSLNDGWARLAILRRSLHGRHNVQDILKSLGRFAGDLLRMGNQVEDAAWPGLLDRDPSDWLKYLQRNFKDSVPKDNDDPVSMHVWQALQSDALKPQLEVIYGLLQSIPQRESKKYGERITELRRALRGELDRVWSLLKGQLSLRLPLLIFDEAHHLKNPETQLVRSLFQDSSQDAEQVNGAFFGVFQKIIFLTATPFQLGHHELLNVLRHFASVAWERQGGSALRLEDFRRATTELTTKLDAAQSEALRLDIAWGRIRPEDLTADGKLCEDGDAWWISAQTGVCEANEIAAAARDQARSTEVKMREAETALRPWVIRHLRPKVFRFHEREVNRRHTLPGRGIEDMQIVETGLVVQRQALLPFLLAARTVAVQPRGRAVFAEGLASSYEAFLYTHRHRDPGIDIDEDGMQVTDSPRLLWYARAIRDSLENKQTGSILEGHPKIEATVNKVMALWQMGEKVVLFCHYVETGRILRRAISSRMQQAIRQMARDKIGAGDVESAAIRLENLGDEFFDKDNAVRRRFDELAMEMTTRSGPALDADEARLVLDVMRRYVRTPAFLARFFLLKEDPLPKDVDAAFMAEDNSGLSLAAIFGEFITFIAKRCGPEERKDYLQALDRLQTGSHLEVKSKWLDGEELGRPGEMLLPNVRLVNGSTRLQARRDLMLAFNTPFYPEVLIASAVLAEGVDLHLNCRHIIHHDLSWNPSTLEQRTGRVDRIGAKVEKCGMPIEIYLPYVAGTQDEKMYRVVIDRERWFKVVMGEELKTDSSATDRLADRVPLPESLAQSLAFDLSVRSNV